MFEFQWPWLFALLPLPLLVWRLTPPHRQVSPAVRVPGPMAQRLAIAAGVEPVDGAVIARRARRRLLILCLVWLSVVAALAGPVWRGEPRTIQRSARDLLLLVDLSGSMETRDAGPRVAGGTEQQTRLDAVKSVMASFIAKRQGDRLGLIVFGEAPYVQVPFTSDTTVVAQLMDEAVVGMAGQSTMLGDALGLAIRLFRHSEAKDRVVILLTDGNDTGSMVPPLQAAYLASKERIVVHVVGFGDPTAAGEDGLNAPVLQAMAAGTGGRYFHANNRAQLDSIYETLDAIEKVTFDTRTWTPKRQLFHYPLALGAVVLCLFFLAQWSTAIRTARRAVAGSTGEPHSLPPDDSLRDDSLRVEASA